MITEMLRGAHEDVKKYYYDATLQGLDWDARYRQYTAQVGKARNLGEGFRIVAAFLGGLKDSHTYFSLRSAPTGTKPDIAWRWWEIHCFITQIRPNTDAASKLHIGDQVVYIDGFNVNRDDFHDLRYYFTVLAPQASGQFNFDRRQAKSGRWR